MAASTDTTTKGNNNCQDKTHVTEKVGSRLARQLGRAM